MTNARGEGSARDGALLTSDSRLPTPDCAARLAELGAGEPGVRAAALTWLGRHAPGALAAAHAGLLTDPAAEVREAAAVAFRVSADPALVNGARLALRDLLLGDRDERRAGLRAAAELANPYTAPRLLPFLADPDPETRRLTLLALAAPPPGFVAPRLLCDAAATGLADPDAGVRAAAARLRDAVGRGA
ncbi:MAG TPA: hypothetical protein VFL91_07425 [Thermomicrobiales bacterium]|nr:hypothetical protein [Thermomicrobiales bacterium]